MLNSGTGCASHPMVTRLCMMAVKVACVRIELINLHFDVFESRVLASRVFL